MKVILIQDVKGLGKAGAVVDVADGYGRNFLVPRGLAHDATAGELQKVKERQGIQRGKEERQLKDAQDLARRVEATSLTVTMRVGENGKLFGAITAKDIANGLKGLGITVDKRKIDVPEAIRSLGVHRVELHPHPDVRATLEVVVKGQ